MCLLDAVVWGGYPGAAVRVVLPITFAFNVLLDHEAPGRFWAWYLLGNGGALWYAPDMLHT
jgi:hypothetical protein